MEKLAEVLREAGYREMPHLVTQGKTTLGNAAETACRRHCVLQGNAAGGQAWQKQHKPQETGERSTWESGREMEKNLQCLSSAFY